MFQATLNKNFFYYNHIYPGPVNRGTDIQFSISLFDTDLCLGLGIQQLKPVLRQRTQVRKLQMCHMYKDRVVIGKCIFGDHIMTGGNRQGKIYVLFLHERID